MNTFKKHVENIWKCFCDGLAEFLIDVKYHEITYPIYIMSRKERRVWKNIKKAAEEGYNEWYNSPYNEPYMLCPPWTKPLTKVEYFVLRHIHEKIYGSDWYVDPLGYYQISWIMYKTVKNRVL